MKVEWIGKRKFKQVLMWSSMTLFLIITLLAIQEKENNLILTGIEVEIEPKDELAFLDSNKVIQIIQGESSQLNLGSLHQNIHLDSIEMRLEKYPFIEKADVLFDLSGRLRVKVLQRKPILRVVNKKGQSYYVAKNGFKMPLNSGYTPRVIIANGMIAESLVDSVFVHSKLLVDLTAIAEYCSRDKFWDSQIEQLYVDNYMDILLIPKVGNHSIVFGSAENLDDKFRRLKTFYLKGLNAVGWDKYKRINLKFKGQIVGEK
jgi:cell division protein FtsQ